MQRWPVKRCVCQFSGPIAHGSEFIFDVFRFICAFRERHCYFGIVVLCVPGRSFVFFVVLVVVVLPAPRGAVRMGETRWRWR